VSNVTADYVTDASQVAELLKQQVSSPVQFTQSVERMIADGVDTFIEIGPGKTLSSFVRKIDRNVKVCNIEKPEDLDRVMEELAC
jgi:[acyl-carrier-protein] S-malonyltransferase